MKITRVGLDIAKQVFQVHGVDERGKARVSKQLARTQVLKFFAQLPPCLIGIEACGSAHYWGREFTKLGHTVKLMAAQFVIPYRPRGKNDANDAEAICEAVGRPNMRFVAIKSEEQQSVLMLHRARTLVVANRTAQVNQIRGLLGEFGLVVPKGVARLRRESAWARRLKERRHVNVVAVALAAKHARIAWAILAHGTEYRPAGPEVVAA
jgi:transposase